LGLQLHDGLPNSLTRVFERQVAVDEIMQIGARATTCVALFPLAILLENDTDFRRISGRTSAAKVPSDDATSTSS
jgi:hypothetical protein